MEKRKHTTQNGRKYLLLFEKYIFCNGQQVRNDDRRMLAVMTST